MYKYTHNGSLAQISLKVQLHILWSDLMSHLSSAVLMHWQKQCREHNSVDGLV